KSADDEGSARQFLAETGMSPHAAASWNHCSVAIDLLAEALGSIQGFTGLLQGLQAARVGKLEFSRDPAPQVAAGAAQLAQGLGLPPPIFGRLNQGKGGLIFHRFWARMSALFWENVGCRRSPSDNQRL